MSETTRVEANLEILAPPQSVWRVLTDFGKLDRWSSLYRNVNWSRLMEVGDYFEFQLALFHKTAQPEQGRLERFDPPVRLVWSVQGTLALINIDISLAPIGRDRTRVRHAIELTSRDDAEAVATGHNKEIAARIDHFNHALADEVGRRKVGN